MRNILYKIDINHTTYLNRTVQFDLKRIGQILGYSGAQNKKRFSV